MRCFSIFILASLANFATSNSLPVSSVCSKVGEDVRSARGRVTSPLYPNNYPGRQECIWRLHPSKGNGIRLYVEDLENQEVFDNGNRDCYDTLEISTLDATNNPTAVDGGELCASNPGELRKRSFEFESSETDSLIVEIKFKSDYEDHKKGFSIYYETLCNETQKGDSGVILSPNYPEKYPAGSDCYTIIKASTGIGIEINFSEFRLEEQITCATDYIVISEGYPGDSDEKSTKLCRPSHVANPIQIFSKIATFQFVSDSTLGYSGFKATWKAMLPATTPITTKAPMKNCSYTINGRTCQRWDETYPNKPKHLPPDPHHNFCRIPDNDTRPWCYTTSADKRWEYCNLDDCKPMTTTVSASTIETDRTATTKISAGTSARFVHKTTFTSEDPSTTTFPSSVNKFIVGESISATQQLSTKEGGIAWYFFLIIPAVILVILSILIIIFAMRRRRKGEARLNADHEASVQFNQMNWDDSRPRENTYVEIPFIEQAGNGHVGRNQRHNEAENPLKNGKEGFVPVDSKAGRNASLSSHDSIKSAKEKVRKTMEAGGPSTSAALLHSTPDDTPTTSKAGVETPYQMAAEVEKAATEENLYQTIGVQEEGNAQKAAIVSRPLPPVQTDQKPKETKPKPKETKKEEKDKKKKGSKKFLLGKKKSSSNISGLGFGNPSYQEKELSPPEEANNTNNPFDSDDDDKKQFRLPSNTRISSSEDWNSPIDINEAKLTQNETKESHYMAPKLPRPNKNSMVTISPEIIDNNDPDADVFAEHDSLYSTPKPTPLSPEFEMENSFVYDLPQIPRPATSSFDSAKSKDSSQLGEENELKSTKGLSQNDTDSGRSSLQDMTSAEDDINQQEYCTMNSVSRGSVASSVDSVTSRKKRKNTDEKKEENRVSLLYMSMKDNSVENEAKELYENLDTK